MLVRLRDGRVVEGDVTLLNGECRRLLATAAVSVKSTSFPEL